MKNYNNILKNKTQINFCNVNLLKFPNKKKKISKVKVLLFIQIVIFQMKKKQKTKLLFLMKKIRQFKN